MSFNYKKIIPYIIAITIFVIASLSYFSPVLKGKKIQQSDITQYIGSSKEIKDFREKNDTEPYWTNATFGGMPAYVISAYYPNEYIKKLDRVIRFLPRPADYLFLYFLGFFVLLMLLKVDWKLAIIGSLGFGFSTYLIIILGVGHNSKAHAIAYFPLVISGILLVFQRKYLFGFILTALAMSLELAANHVQMTYYLFFLILIFGIVQLISSVKNKELPHFAKAVGVLLVAVILAIGTNATNLLATQEYAKHSTRSKSELTITPDGKEKVATTGLDKLYITQYSYGKLETFNLFIPRFMGGTSHEEVKDSEVRSFLQDAVNKGLNPDYANYLLRVASMYWGDQPIVAAPAYIGAIFIFLFVLAMFLVKGNLKKWLVAATVFSILMSWGKNLSFLTDFFINYVPLYNKFRAVSSIQVIAELTIPLLGILGLKELFSSDVSKESKIKSLKFTTIIVGGLALLLIVFGEIGVLSFIIDGELGFNDSLEKQEISGFLDAVVADRQTLFFNDSLRTLGLVLALAAVLWLFINEKINQTIVLISFATLLLFDLVTVDKRYVNDDYFASARKVKKPFKKSTIDAEILKDKTYYRVADFTKNPLNDGTTSYFHKSIGGYSAAKPMRYQELFDFHIDLRNNKVNPEVLNMLNTKYIINVNEKGQKALQKNDNANGNAWFVEELKVVTNANEEIKGLDAVDTKKIAIIRSDFAKDLPTKYVVDSTAIIKLTDYKANALTFENVANSSQFAVFSDMYYKDGWTATIDGKETPIYRVDYVLRGLSIPKGKHTIKFKFEPTVIKKGNTITLISYALLFLIPIAWFMIEKKKK